MAERDGHAKPGAERAAPGPPYERIVVIGATGSGKSTMAERIATHFGHDLIELDAIYWTPNWVPLPEPELLRRVDEATRRPRWVVAGNYSRLRGIVWARAQSVVWLDYPLPTVVRQLTGRTLRRWWSRELLWGTNRESLVTHLKLWSDDSLYRWLFRTHGRHRREYPRAFAAPEHAHLSVIELHSPREADHWLESLQRSARRAPGRNAPRPAGR